MSASTHGVNLPDYAGWVVVSTHGVDLPDYAGTMVVSDQ